MKRKGSGYSQERKRDQDAKNATEHIPPPHPHNNTVSVLVKKQTNKQNNN